MIRWLSFSRALWHGRHASNGSADAAAGVLDVGLRLHEDDAASVHERSRSLRAWQVMLWLGLPLCVYLIPLLAGYGWTSQSPGTPNVLGIDGLDGYSERSPEVAISVERYGTGVVFVPFQARLRQFLQAHQLPLWNPYQGLGEPFAAQGDGNPYFPVEIVRALLPYSLGNFVTFVEFYVAAVCVYLFLRGLGTSQYAAILGGVAYPLSGALSLHIPRPNLADQLCMIPVVFWATGLAVRRRSTLGYVLLALAAGLHLLGGFIQIAMISALVVTLFCALYAWLLFPTVRGWLRSSITVIGAFVLGNALAAFYLLPQLEAARITFNKNAELLAFLPMPYANLTAFFFPILFGPFFQTWITVGYPEGVDWNNLYAYAGTALLLLPVLGWLLVRRDGTGQRAILIFFAVASAVLLLRFVSFPLVSGVDLLPGLGRQSPKHSHGLAVFCLVVAAAIAVDHLRARPGVRVRWPVAIVLLLAGSAVLTVVGKGGGWAAVNTSSVRLFGGASVFIVVVLLAALWLARRWTRLSADGAKVLVLAAVCGELSVYVPLGNGTPEVLDARLGVSLLIVGSGLLWALRRRLMATGCLVAAVLMYTLVIVTPPVGLPKRFDMDTPPAFLNWLAANAGQNYRTFGVPPDFSSLVGVQDIGTVGPLAPGVFADFVSVVSEPGVNAFYRSSSTFMLTTVPQDAYNLERAYLNIRPVMDWIGIRYLVLDRSYFRPTPGGRQDDQALLALDSAASVVYEDPWVRVVESATAQPKALFSSAIAIYPDQLTILRQLRSHPDTVYGPLMVEAGALPRLTGAPSDQADKSMPVDVVTYAPNTVQLRLDAPSAGIVVLKDAFYPGWRGRVNGMDAEVIRVDGLVRGIALPTAGHYEVEFNYLPDSFLQGVLLSGLTAALLVVVASSAALASWRRERHMREPLDTRPSIAGDSASTEYADAPAV